MSQSDTAFSVVIPTRNRPADAEGCARSVLANPGDFDLVVVDQSTDDATAEKLAAINDRRLTLLRPKEKGVSLARNLGAAHARGEVIGFTDDDCRVPTDWVASHREPFASDRSLDMAFGPVLLTAAKPGGWGAAFEPTERTVQAERWPIGDDQWGLSANMVIRRSALESLGGFDPLLGAGAALAGGEDIDLQMRALASGQRILYSLAPPVAHFGVRYGDEARRLILIYSAAFGATLAKQVLLGSPGARGYALALLARKSTTVAGQLARLKRPRGAAQILALVKGYRALSGAFGVSKEKGWLIRLEPEPA